MTNKNDIYIKKIKKYLMYIILITMHCDTDYKEIKATNKNNYM